MSNIDNELENIQSKIKALVEENNKLVAKKAEEEAAKKKIKSKEQLELVKLRESIKKSIDEFNEYANKYKINVGVGLLTTGGENIYDVEDGESAEGEYFSDSDESGNYNTYGKKFWFPSSLNC